MAVSGSIQFSSAFSQKIWKPLPGHSKIVYEINKDEEQIEDINKKAITKTKTKFDKLMNTTISNKESLIKGQKAKISEYDEHKNRVLEDYWVTDIKKYEKQKEKEKINFVFIKTGHKRKDQYNFAKNARILPLGNYLADDYSVSDSIVLDVLAKARADGNQKNIVRTSYDRMELQFFDSPYSTPVVGKAHERAKMGQKTQDIDIVQTRVLMKKL